MNEIMELLLEQGNPLAVIPTSIYNLTEVESHQTFPAVESRFHKGTIFLDKDYHKFISRMLSDEAF